MMIGVSDNAELLALSDGDLCDACATGSESPLPYALWRTSRGTRVVSFPDGLTFETDDRGMAAMLRDAIIAILGEGDHEV